MNISRRLVLALLLTGALLSACTTSPPSNQKTPAEPESPTATQPPQPTPSSTIQPTATSTPAVPTSLPSPTLTPTPEGPSLLAQIGKGLLLEAALSPDGRILAVTSSLGLYLLDADTMQEINHLSLEEQDITAVNWSPDGRQITLGSDQGMVISLDPGSGQTLEQVTFTGRINQLVWAPHSPVVAVVVQTPANEGASRKAVYLWDLDTQQTQPLLTREDVSVEEEYSLSQIAWSPDGNKIAAGSLSGSVYIQALDSPAGAQVLHPYQGKLAYQKIADLAWSPDENRIAVAWQGYNPGLPSSAESEEMVMIWDVQENIVLDAYPEAGGKFVSWIPDGTLITVENKHLVFHNSEGVIDQRVPLSHTVHQASWSGDHRYLLLQSYTGSLTFWDQEQKTARTTTLNDFYVQGISQTGWSSQGDRLAALGFANGRLSIWGFEQEFSPQKTLEGINQFSWSPVDNTLAAVNYDGQLALYEGSSLEIVRGLPIPANQSIDSLAWSPDGKKIALLIQKYQVYGMAAELLDAWITILDAASFTPLHRFGVMDDLTGYSQSNGVTCLAWSPDNQQLAGGTYHGDILIWDAAAGQVIQTMSGHKHGINSLDWSPDGSQLLSGSLDGTAAVWERSSGGMRRQYRNFPGEFQGDVRDVDWKKDTDWFAVGAWSEIRILGGTTSYKIPFGPGTIHDIDWSNTDPLLAVSGNGIVQIWQLP